MMKGMAFVGRAVIDLSVEAPVMTGVKDGNMMHRDPDMVMNGMFPKLGRLGHSSWSGHVEHQRSSPKVMVGKFFITLLR